MDIKTKIENRIAQIKVVQASYSPMDPVCLMYDGEVISLRWVLEELEKDKNKPVCQCVGISHDNACHLFVLPY